MSYEFLQTLWFILIAVLWIGFYFLEGFDFGVGMLLPFVGKKDEERRAIINTIGSVWDGNEVWLPRYVEAVAPHMVPEIAGRPMMLLRCPEGRRAPCFFQKHPGGSEHPAVEPIRVRGA